MIVLIFDSLIEDLDIKKKPELSTMFVYLKSTNILLETIVN